MNLPETTDSLSDQVSAWMGHEGETEGPLTIKLGSALRSPSRPNCKYMVFLTAPIFTADLGLVNAVGGDIGYVKAARSHTGGWTGPTLMDDNGALVFAHEVLHLLGAQHVLAEGSTDVVYTNEWETCGSHCTVGLSLPQYGEAGIRTVNRSMWLSAPEPHQARVQTAYSAELGRPLTGVYASNVRYRPGNAMTTAWLLECEKGLVASSDRGCFIMSGHTFTRWHEGGGVGRFGAPVGPQAHNGFQPCEKGVVSRSTPTFSLSI